MRNSVSHLPSGRRTQVMDITDIILQTLRPEKIILFGSFARGTFVDHSYTSKDQVLYEYVSDYDFLVIVPELEEKEYILEEKVREQTRFYKQPINLIVHDTQFINQSLAEGWYFFSDIVKEGILLFDASGEPLATAKTLSEEEKRQRNQLYFDNWMKRGSEFKIDARNALERGSLKNAVFYLHQATESFYYTMLLVHTSYKPKTHHLYKLRQQTKNFSEKLYFLFHPESVAEDKRLFDLLKKGYVDARYNEGYEISKEDLAILLDRIDLMEKMVAESCRELL